MILQDMDFETGDFSQQIGGDQTGDTIIVYNGSHSGRYATRCRGPPVSSIRMWGGIDPTKYKELYYDFWVYVDLGFEVPAGPEWQMIAEWCAPNPVSCNDHVALTFMNAYGVRNNLGIHFRSATGKLPYQWGLPVPPGTVIYEMFSGNEMPTGKWLHFEVYWLTDMVNGTIQVKMNGRILIEWKGRTQFDPENGNNEISFTCTNYCHTDLPIHNIYFDDIYIGSMPKITPTSPLEVTVRIIGPIGIGLYLIGNTSRRG